MSNLENIGTDPARLRQLADSLGYLLESDIRDLYNITRSTAESWRKRGHGPKHITAGNTPLYPRDAVIADLASRIRERSAPSGKDAL